MKCVAIDDEPLALSQITNYISRVPFLELVKGCQDAFEALQIMSSHQVDLIFVDINMPDLNGLELVRSLVNPPMVIFTTAYSEYAVEGYRVDAVDYLLKPFDFQDFCRATGKALKFWELKNASANHPVSIAETPAFPAEDDSLFVKTEYKVVRINIATIKYVESMSEYVRIYTETDEKPVMTLLSMKKLEGCLPADRFMRVHRSYLVNLQKINEVSRLRIVFDGDTYIPVGDLYKEKFLEYISRKSVGK